MRALKSIAQYQVASGSPRPNRRPFAMGGVRPAIVGAAALITLAVGGLPCANFMRPALPPAPPPLQLSVATPPTPEVNDFFGISPDARFIVYRVLPELEADSPTPPGPHDGPAPRQRPSGVQRPDPDRADLLSVASKAALQPERLAASDQNGVFTPDGRLLHIMKAEEEGKNRVDVIVNFVDEMRAKVEAGR